MCADGKSYTPSSTDNKQYTLNTNEMAGAKKISIKVPSSLTLSLDQTSSKNFLNQEFCEQEFQYFFQAFLSGGPEKKSSQIFRAKKDSTQPQFTVEIDLV